MIQQQRFGTGLLATPGVIVGESGLKGLFGRGLAMSCGREGTFCAGMLGLSPVFRDHAHEAWGWSASVSSVFGAAAAGSIVATLSHPVRRAGVGEGGGSNRLRPQPASAADDAPFFLCLRALYSTPLCIPAAPTRLDFAGLPLARRLAYATRAPAAQLDTVKTCQQGDLAARTYGGAMATARALYAQGGAARFFSG